MGKITAMSVAAKTAVAGACAVALIGAVGVPVHMHNENQKAVAAMAAIQAKQEAEAARQEAARIESERVQAEFASLIEAIKTALDAVDSSYDKDKIVMLELKALANEITKLNTFLLATDDVANVEDVKVVIEDADALTVGMDLADPTKTATADSDIQLKAVREAILKALELLDIEAAVPHVERIDLAQTEIAGEIGDVLTVDTKVYPTAVRGSELLIWGTSDDSIADVDEDGGILLKKAGECSISVRDAYSGAHSRIIVTVRDKVVAIENWYTAPNAGAIEGQGGKNGEVGNSGAARSKADNGYAPPNKGNTLTDQSEIDRLAPPGWHNDTGKPRQSNPLWSGGSK